MLCPLTGRGGTQPGLHVHAARRSLANPAHVSASHYKMNPSGQKCCTRDGTHGSLVCVIELIHGCRESRTGIEASCRSRFPSGPLQDEQDPDAPMFEHCSSMTRLNLADNWCGMPHRSTLLDMLQNMSSGDPALATAVVPYDPTVCSRPRIIPSYTHRHAPHCLEGTGEHIIVVSRSLVMPGLRMASIPHVFRGFEKLEPWQHPSTQHVHWQVHLQLEGSLSLFVLSLALLLPHNFLI